MFLHMITMMALKYETSFMLFEKKYEIGAKTIILYMLRWLSNYDQFE